MNERRFESVEAEEISITHAPDPLQLHAGQTRLDSLVETLVQNTLGTVVTATFLGTGVLSDPVLLAVCISVLNVVRTYFLRRMFEGFSRPR